jgi:hypothetical protein
MIMSVTDIKTAGNPAETLSDRELLEVLAGRVEILIRETTGRLNHMDGLLHDTERNVREIREFIEEHRPALARGLALMGGPRLGSWLGTRKARD